MRNHRQTETAALAGLGAFVSKGGDWAPVRTALQVKAVPPEATSYQPSAISYQPSLDS
jgi:hypothetical protein